MRTSEGRVTQIQLKTNGQSTAWIACPKRAIPSPGQYLLAWSPADPDAPLGTPLFASEITGEGFLAVPPIPRAWMPGTPLLLRGPLGRGFELPASAVRLALAAAGETAERLMPLAIQAMQTGCAVVLLKDGGLPAIPSWMEAYPLGNLPEILAWADFLALDLPLEDLPRLRPLLGIKPAERLPCPAQALILTDMPCSGLADCGVCAVPARQGWKLACKDGPVFDLNDLEW